MSPIGIFISSNALWYLYAGGVLWVRNSAQRGSVKSVSSVREKSSQRFVCVSSHRVDAFFFSQKNTEEQISQRFTETLSQPITQNLTATFSSNALWTLYAGGLLWARNCAPKSSVNSVRSVREKPIHTHLLCSLSHRRTQMNRTRKGPQRH